MTGNCHKLSWQWHCSARGGTDGSTGVKKRVLVKKGRAIAAEHKRPHSALFKLRNVICQVPAQPNISLALAYYTVSC